MVDDINFGDGGWWEDEPQDSYAQIVITVAGRAPLLAADRYARVIVDALDAARSAAPGLWAYTVLPDSVRLVVGPASVEAIDNFVAQVKAATAPRLLDVIRRADDNTLDAVLRFNPLWGGAIYRVWAGGYHRVLFTTEYRLSNAIYATRQHPVTLELVADAADWPYSWVGGA